MVCLNVLFFLFNVIPGSLESFFIIHLGISNEEVLQRLVIILSDSAFMYNGPLITGC